MLAYLQARRKAIVALALQVVALVALAEHADPSLVGAIDAVITTAGVLLVPND